MNDWPKLNYQEHVKSIETLHLFTQIVGKIRLANTEWFNHSWHIPLYVTVRGLSTGLVQTVDASFELEFDFSSHQLRLSVAGKPDRHLPLIGVSVAEFYDALKSLMGENKISTDFHPFPNEVPDPVHFAENRQLKHYDRSYVNDLWAALLQIRRVFGVFRTGFLGKSSPVHFFWGSFDLASTRFSGRTAPRHPGGVPNLSDLVTQEAYSHEVSSSGFWPGGGGVDEPAFYSYAYPVPAGFSQSIVSPNEATFSEGLGEFVLPYSAVAQSEDPDGTLLGFLQSTFVAAAEHAGWPLEELECEFGERGKPRQV